MGSPRARRAQTPGSCPKRASPGPTPGPTPTPVGFLIAQDGDGRWGSLGPPPLTTRGGPAPVASGRASGSHGEALPPCPGGGRGRRRPLGDTTWTTEETSWNQQGRELRGHCPHCRAWPRCLLPRAGDGRGARGPARRLPTPALPGERRLFPHQRKSRPGCWPAGVSATQVVGTRKLRLCGALYSKWKTCEKVVQYFSCQGYYST